MALTITTTDKSIFINGQRLVNKGNVDVTVDATNGLIKIAGYNAAPFNEVTIDGTSYGTIGALIDVLKDKLFKNGGSTGGSGVQSVDQGLGIIIDNTDPSNPVVTNGLINTDPPVDTSNKFAVAGTGAWDPATAIGSTAVINSTSTYTNWRYGNLINVIPGKGYIIAGRNKVGSTFGVYYNENNLKVANTAISDLTDIGNNRERLVIPNGVYKIGLHFNNANASFPAASVTFSQEAGTGQEGKVYPEYIPKIKKVLNGIWNACGTSITFYDGTIYADGQQAGQITKGYQTWVQEEVSFTGGVRNYGLGGHSWANNTTNSNTIVNKMTTWLAAKYWSAEGATNDFKLNTVIGAESDYLNNTGAGTLYGAMRLFVDRVYALGSDSVIIFITDPHRNNDSYTSYSVNTIGNALENYHDVFRWVANRTGSPLCDTFRRGGINDSNLSQMTRDGLHPIDEGYRLMSREITTVFRFL